MKTSFTSIHDLRGSKAIILALAALAGWFFSIWLQAGINAVAYWFVAMPPHGGRLSEGEMLSTQISCAVAWPVLVAVVYHVRSAWKDHAQGRWLLRIGFGFPFSLLVLRLLEILGIVRIYIPSSKWKLADLSLAGSQSIIDLGSESLFFASLMAISTLLWILVYTVYGRKTECQSPQSNQRALKL